jgi:uncharacterized membrane protein YbhN (UPF0104 family)
MLVVAFFWGTVCAVVYICLWATGVHISVIHYLLVLLVGFAIGRTEP